MRRETVLLGLGIAAALAAGIASGDNLASRAVRERQQQSDAFDLQLEQSLQSSRAGSLGPDGQLSRFRSGPAVPGLTAGRPAPLAGTTVVTGSDPRARAEAMDAPAASPGADLARPEALAAVRRIESEADALWQGALRGDWSAAQIALDHARQSVNVLRTGLFKTEYTDRGGDPQSLAAAALDRLDAAIAGVEAPLEARDAAAVMRGADELQTAAADLTVY